MRKPILVVLLGLGTVFGYASGIAQIAHCHRHHRQSFEEHVADVCVHAADRSRNQDAPQ